VVVDGIAVTVVRKKMKTIRLHVTARTGEVWVSAPYRVSQGAIKRFVASHTAWIRSAQERAKTHVPPSPDTPPAYDADAHVPLWGNPLRVVVREAPGPAGAEQRGADLVITVPPGHNSPQTRQLAVDRFHRSAIGAGIEREAAVWQERVGRSASRWTVRPMKTRWGSANHRTRRISINLALAGLDPAFLRYVVVHELVHLWEPNHGPGFYARMDRLLPDWRTTRRALRHPQAT
jgi:predicted metal-dependent hydrolase